MDATDVMDSLVVPDLKAIAKRAGIDKSITRKPELIRALNNFVKTKPANFLNRLDPIERDFLAEAVHNNNRVSPVVFSAKYNVEYPVGYDRSLLRMVILKDRDSCEIEIPETIADLLRPLLDRPASPRVSTVEQLPATLDSEHMKARPIHVYCGEQTALLELRRVLQLVLGGKVCIQPKSGRPTPGTERAIAATLAMPDFELESSESEDGGSGPVRPHAWPVLIQQCGWAKASGQMLKLTKEGTRLLKDLSPSAFREGVQELASDDQFDELQRINNIRGQTGRNARSWMSDPSERREEILEGIAEWPANQWLTFEEAYRFLRACGHVFSVTENPLSLYFCELRYGYITDEDGIDRQYLRAFLMESLATLGLVDVAYVFPDWLWPELGGGWGTDDMDFCGRYDGLLYVRLNSLGEYSLGRSEQYLPPASERRSLLTVLPNFEITVSTARELLPGDVSMLELFATKKSDHVWRIEPPLILDYLETGGSVDDILTFLVDNGAMEIPQAIRVLFEDLMAKVGAAIKAEPALLIEFGDPALAALVAHDSRAGKLCLPAGERHVAVAKTNERAFRTALKKLGYILPR